jgi:hypothetical protein
MKIVAVLLVLWLPVVVAAPAASFDDIWWDRIDKTSEPPPKADRLRPSAPRLPLPPTPSPSLSLPPPPAESVAADPPPPPPRARIWRARAQLDLCQRHHMHKVITRHGHGWRCR